MAGDVVNVKVCIPHKRDSGLTGNYYAICHYSYNLPLANIPNENINPDFNNCPNFKKL